MFVLVANLGSTSFKYRLLEKTAEGFEVRLRGGFERVEDHGKAIEQALEEIRQAGIAPETIDGVGFKTVLGKNLSGCVAGDERALVALEEFAEVAPAHNPPYVAGIRQFARLLPEVPRFCLFETAFYQWMPETSTRYAVPQSWYEAGIRRYGFHGASHKANSERAARLLGREDVAKRVQNLYVKGVEPLQEGQKPLRVVSLHLGGSSSLTALLDGVALATSMGFSPQSGLPQNNRVGDLDAMAIPFACQALGISVEEARQQLSSQGGLLGLSKGISNDLRDLKQAAAKGNKEAAFAIDYLLAEIRRYLGSFILQLGGLDALVFSGGIAENNPDIRAHICQFLEPFGLQLDAQANADSKETITTETSAIAAFVLEADEELVIAQEVACQLNHLSAENLSSSKTTS